MVGSKIHPFSQPPKKTNYHTRSKGQNWPFAPMREKPQVFGLPRLPGGSPGRRRPGGGLWGREDGCDDAANNVYIILQLASLYFAESYHSHIISKTPSKTASILQLGKHMTSQPLQPNSWHGKASLSKRARMTASDFQTNRNSGMKIPKQKESNPGGGFNPSEKY